MVSAREWHEEPWFEWEVFDLVEGAGSGVLAMVNGHMGQCSRYRAVLGFIYVDNGQTRVGPRDW